MATSFNIDLKFPTGWNQLTNKQLKQVFWLISSNIFSAKQITFILLLKWNKIKVIGLNQNKKYTVKVGKKYIQITPLELAELLQSIDWVAKIPEFPIRFTDIRGTEPLDAVLQQVPFKTYIYCDNLYQGYLKTKNEDLLNQLTNILYNTNKERKFNDIVKISALYWFISLKNYLAKRFPDFYVNPDEQSKNYLAEAPIANMMQEAMDAQIRALTKGDITKEENILNLDTHRALTELNAQAKEYKLLKSTK